MLALEPSDRARARLIILRGSRRGRVSGQKKLRDGTQLIHRSAMILRVLAANNRLGMRLVDIYRAAQLERPTAHRILQGLVAEQLIRQDHRSKRYFLGNLLYEIGLAAAPGQSLRDISHPYVQALAEQTGDTVFLCVRSGFDAVCIDRQEGAHPIKAFVLDVGRRRPVNVGASGMAILSALPKAQAANIIKVNHERTVERYPQYSVKSLEERLARARKTGFVVNDVLEVPGVRAVAMAIRDTSGQPIGAISVSAVIARLESTRLEMVRSYIGSAVAEIQSRLNGKVDDTNVLPKSAR